MFALPRLRRKSINLVFAATAFVAVVAIAAVPSMKLTASTDEGKARFWFATNQTAPSSAPLIGDGSWLVDMLGGFYGAGLKNFASPRSLSLAQGTSSYDPCTTPSFLAPRTFTAGGGVRPIITGDFDADGKLDVAAAYGSTATNSSVIVLRGDGAGNLTTLSTVRVGTLPSWIVAGDFNSDGKIDLATANRNGNNVSVLTGDGAGAFVRNDFTVGSSTNPQYLVAGDFNSDGKLDLATANRSTSNISLLLNNGAGGFNLPINFPTGPAPNAMATGDFNADGKLDIVAANEGTGTVPSDNALSLLLGDGVGGFAPVVSVPVAAKPLSVATDDFNFDGKLDLAVGTAPSSGARTVTILLGDGTGAFGAPTPYTVANSPASPVSLVTADLSGDGNKDLTIANAGSHTVSVLLGDGQGAFGGSTPIQTGASTSPQGIAAGDFNGDGRIDLTTANTSAGTVSIFINSCSVPDLTLTKNHVGSFSTGYQGVYTLTVTNAGTGSNTGPITITDSLPAGLSYVSAMGALWSCSAVGQNITCTYEDRLGANASTDVTLTVNIESAAAPSVTNTANVTTPNEFNTTNNAASVTTPINTPPVAQNVSISTDEDTPVPVTLSATDANNDPLTYLIVTPPTKGTLSGTAPNLTYTPNLNTNGTDSFTFKANDGQADSNIASVTITVNPVDDPPVAASDSYSASEDTPLNVPVSSGVLANDTEPDGATLSAQLVTNVMNGALTLNPDGSFSYTPNTNFTGSDTFTYQTGDGTNFSPAATVTITVNGDNDPPTANNQSTSTNEEIPVAITLTGSDVEGAVLTYTVVTPPTSGMLTGTGSDLTYTPNLNFNGADSFTFKVNDGLADSNTATVTITVNPVNDPPVAVNDSYSVNHGATLNVPATSGVLVNDSDVEGSLLAAQLISDVTNGALTLNPDGSFSYTPSTPGTDTFTYATSDGASTSNTATVTIIVSPVTDLSITKADSLDPASLGAPLTYSLIVTNAGPSAATNVVATDTLPSSVAFVSAETTQGTCSGSSTVTCNLGNMAANTTATITIVVTPSSSGTLINTASVTGTENDPTSANNTDEERTIVTVDLCEAPTFGAPSSFASRPFPRAVAAADLNADGKLDLAVANRNGNDVSVLLGSGSSGFAPATNFSTGASSAPSAVQILDLNKDGKLDLAVASRNTHSVSVLLGNGAGGFSAVNSFRIGASGSTQHPVALAAGDFNGDNNVDIATANESANNFSVMLGDGAGGFSAATSFGSVTSAFAIVAGDFNADSKLDLAIASNRAAGTVALFTGDGAGAFIAAGTFAVGGNPESIVARDFNGDNRLDLATANSSGNNVSVLLANIAGGFSAATNIAVGTTPRGIDAGDINNDGQLDLVVANGASNNITILTGDAAGVFTPSGNFATGTLPNAIVAGDFSGDGRLDLATANGNGSTNSSISVLINSCNSSDLQLTKTHVGDFTVGQNGTYTLTVTNVGASATFGSISLIDTLPAGLTYVSATGAGWSCSASGQTVTCNSTDALAASATTTVELVVAVTASAAARVTNTATVSNASDINSVNNTANDPTNVRAVADLAITKTASAARVAVGNNITYTITVTNAGPSTATDVVVTDTLPAGLSFVSAQTTAGTCTGTQTVTCTRGSLLSNTSLTITIVGTAQTEGTLNNTASVTTTAFDPDTSDDSATVQTTVGAGGDLALTITGAPNPVNAGSNITYTINVTNSGETSNSVVVTDNLPANLTFVSCASTAGGTCGGTGNNRTVTIPSLANNATATITLVATVKSPLASGTLIVNNASVSSSTPDPQAANNSASHSATVNAPTLSYSPTQIDFGTQIITTTSAPQLVTITNVGTAPLVVSGVALGGVSPNQYIIASNNCPAAGVAPNASCTIGVSFKPTDIAIRIAVLRFSHNAVGGSPREVQLQGQGTMPVAAGWGANSQGQLGNGVRTNALTPVQFGSLGGGVIFEGGASHTLALKPDGTIWAAGANGDGQIGDGTVTRRETPIRVASLSNAVGIAAGTTHSLAVLSNGTVWAWGRNNNGQLGDGTTITRRLPVQISGLTDVVAVAAASTYSLALKSDGTVWAWGFNGSGQLGDNTTITRTRPVQVQGLNEVKFIAAGGSHALAVKTDGTVWAWGANNNGQLGINSTAASKVPVKVSTLTGVDVVAGGGNHSLALKSDGTVWAWGLNSSGQYGNGTTTKSLVPLQIDSGAKGIAAGTSHTLVLRLDGIVRAAGLNSSGQLGDNSTANRSRFVEVRNLAGAASVAAGENSSFAAAPAP